MLNKTYNSYHFGLSTALSDQQLERFVKLFNTLGNRVDSVLGGRTSVKMVRIPGLGPMVVKYYVRGGLIQHFIKRSYLRWGKTRCQIEYEILNKVRHLGIGAPEPVAFAFEGRLFYRCWLITKEIKQHQSLAQLSLSDPDLALSLISQVASQVCTLIQNKIRHVDLHPGNVLVDAKSNIFLIDFDKAYLTRLNTHKLRTKYSDRWKRAVIKHRLPERLWKTLTTELQKNE